MADTMPLTFSDRLYAWRDRLVGSPTFQRWAAAFPLTRPIARRQAAQLFDLVAGFVYSQVLFGLRPARDCSRSSPRARRASARWRTGSNCRTTPPAVCSPPRPRCGLLSAAATAAMALGQLGAAMVGNRAVSAMVEHHASRLPRSGATRWHCCVGDSPDPPCRLLGLCRRRRQRAGARPERRSGRRVLGPDVRFAAAGRADQIIDA
jgi:hypothetical protein